MLETLYIHRVSLDATGPGFWWAPVLKPLSSPPSSSPPPSITLFLPLLLLSLSLLLQSSSIYVSCRPTTQPPNLTTLCAFYTTLPSTILSFFYEPLSLSPSLSSPVRPPFLIRRCTQFTTFSRRTLLRPPSTFSCYFKSYFACMSSTM